MSLLSSLLIRIGTVALRRYDRQPTGDALRQAQLRILSQLITRFRSLPLGQHFSLNQLRIDDSLPTTFAQCVPQTHYADYEALLLRVSRGEPNVMFPGLAIALAQTSGTTSSTTSGERYIPQSAALLKHHRSGGAVALTRLLAAAGASLCDGGMLMLGGSTALTTNAHGIPHGDLSGIIAARLPRWITSHHEPGTAIALESNWERKLERICERCAHRDIRLVSGNMSWMLMLFERICQARGVKRIQDAWPNLRGLIHGGHAAQPFMSHMREHIDAQVKLLEVYPASEAFLAVGEHTWSIDDAPPALMGLGDHGVYFEFAACDDPAHVVGLADLEPERRYEVLVTTPGGLLRYSIGDVITACGPGRYRVSGRLKTRLSVFGEHLESAHMETALATALTQCGGSIAYFHVAPYWVGPANGGHQWLLACTVPPPDVSAFAEMLDADLRSLSLDYAAYRDGGHLLPPRVTIVSPAAVEAYLTSVGKLGGQHKVPVAWEDRSIADSILAAEKTLKNQ